MTITDYAENLARITVGVVRLRGRSRCVNCRRRRVVYRVYLSTTAGSDTTGARCRECWRMNDRGEEER